MATEVLQPQSAPGGFDLKRGRKEGTAMKEAASGSALSLPVCGACVTDR